MSEPICVFDLLWPEQQAAVIRAQAESDRQWAAMFAAYDPGGYVWKAIYEPPDFEEPDA